MGKEFGHTKLVKSVMLIGVIGILIAAFITAFSTIGTEHGGCVDTPASIRGWVSTLINDTSDNEATGIVYNPTLPSWFTVLWHDTQGPGSVGEAMWNGTTETWDEQLIGCASGGHGLAVDSQQGLDIYATHINALGALELNYGGWGVAWTCCEEDNTTSPMLGNWTSVVVNETTGGPDYAVAYYNALGTDLYFKSIAVPCTGVLATPEAVEADAMGPLDYGKYVSMIWDSFNGRYGLFYLNDSSGDVLHSERMALGVYVTEVVAAGVQTAGASYPNIDAHDLFGDQSIACYYNEVNDTLEIVYGTVGGPWTTEELDDGGKYCSIDIKDETLGWYQILYQGNDSSLKYVEGIPGLGPFSIEVVNSTMDARYTDTLIDPADNDTVGSVEDNNDNSTWFVYNDTTVTAGSTSCTGEVGDVTQDLIEAFGDAGSFLSIIIIVIICGIVMYYVFKARGGGAR